MTPLRAAAEVHVANRATRWPVSPIDVVLAGPLVARLLFGATPIGRAVQAVSLGLYLLAPPALAGFTEGVPVAHQALRLLVPVAFQPKG